MYVQCCALISDLWLPITSHPELSEIFKSKRTMRHSFASSAFPNSKAKLRDGRFQSSENLRINLTHSRLVEQDWIIIFNCSSHHFLFVLPSWTVTVNSCTVQFTGSFGVGESDSPLSGSSLGNLWLVHLPGTGLNTESWIRVSNYLSVSSSSLSLWGLPETLKSTHWPEHFFNPNIKY